MNKRIDPQEFGRAADRIGYELRATIERRRTRQALIAFGSGAAVLAIAAGIAAALEHVEAAGLLGIAAYTLSVIAVAIAIDNRENA